MRNAWSKPKHFTVIGATTKPELWTMDLSVDWTMDWAFLIEMSCLAINWFAAWPICWEQCIHKGGKSLKYRGNERDGCYLKSVNVIMKLAGV